MKIKKKGRFADFDPSPSTIKYNPLSFSNFYLFHFYVLKRLKISKISKNLYQIL